METSSSYLFILRMWYEGGQWRWSLKRAGEPDRLGFPDLDSLYLYLSALTEGSIEADESKPDPSALDPKA